MSRNTMLALVALLLVALVGGAGAVWAYKKYRQKQNQEYQLEGTMPFKARVGVAAEEVKEQMLTDDLLDHLLEKHDLVNVWKVADADAAKARVREKFTVIVDGTEIKVRYRDKDKKLVKDLLQSIANSYVEKLRKSMPPPASQLPGAKVPAPPSSLSDLLNPANSFYKLAQIAPASLQVFQSIPVSPHHLTSISKTFYPNFAKPDRLLAALNNPLGAVSGLG